MYSPTSPNNHSRCLLDELNSIEKFVSLGDDFAYKKLGIVSAFYNSIPTRLICLKCKQGKGRTKSRIYKSCKSLAHHLVKDHKNIDSYEFPTTQQSLRLLELYSMMQQLKMVDV